MIKDFLNYNLHISVLGVLAIVVDLVFLGWLVKIHISDLKLEIKRYGTIIDSFLDAQDAEFETHNSKIIYPGVLKNPMFSDGETKSD